MSNFTQLIFIAAAMVTLSRQVLTTVNVVFL